jgi:hypothetical protein
MNKEIIENINSPEILEKLYRSDKHGFKKAFEQVYSENKHQSVLQIWNQRLNYQDAKTGVIASPAFWLAFKLVIVAGLVANISNLSGINKEMFFTRNTSFIVIPFMAAYFIWKQNLPINKKVTFGILFLLSALYMNYLPNNVNSSSINLALIHLPLFLWSILGLSYLGDDLYDNSKRINFLKYNGDLFVICVVLFLSSVLFTVITFGLFELIGIKIEKFYIEYIAIWGIGAIPIFGTYLIDNNPQIINKVTPIIAKVFAPLALVNLTIYLITLIYTGKYPHHDRNLLLIYNALLVGVLALIFFSIAETEKNNNKIYNSILLLGLSGLTIIINTIALYAISYRILEYGMTPNRVAVLGGNILIFVNLLIVAYKLINVVRNKSELAEVESSIAKYLPVYAIWTGLVALLMPLIFSFK